MAPSLVSKAFLLLDGTLGQRRMLARATAPCSKRPAAESNAAAVASRGGWLGSRGRRLGGLLDRNWPALVDGRVGASQVVLGTGGYIGAGVRSGADPDGPGRRNGSIRGSRNGRSATGCREQRGCDKECSQFVHRNRYNARRHIR